jgi:hypothetical protein
MKLKRLNYCKVEKQSYLKYECKNHSIKSPDIFEPPEIRSPCSVQEGKCSNYFQNAKINKEEQVVMRLTENLYIDAKKRKGFLQLDEQIDANHCMPFMRMARRNGIKPSSKYNPISCSRIICSDIAEHMEGVIHSLGSGKTSDFALEKESLKRKRSFVEIVDSDYKKLLKYESD